jgi:hypothetical protein
VAPGARALARPEVDLDRIALRKAERGFVAGGSDAGKSYLAEMLGAYFVLYYQRQKARRLVLDSKPRFRAQVTVNGRPAKYRYKNWDHGPFVKDSVVVDDPSQLELAFSLGYRTVIAQCEEAGSEIDRLVATADAFLRTSKASRPQLLQVDEVMDFYHENGAARGGSNVILRSARAGRERGTAGLYCSQRTRGIPASLMSEMLRLYAFRLDAVNDAKRFQEFGAPPFALPRAKRQFMYWYKEDYEKVWGPYTLV